MKKLTTDSRIKNLMDIKNVINLKLNKSDGMTAEEW